MSPPENKKVDAPPTPLAAAFDPESCGTIFGQVCWRGELPQCPPFEAQGPGPDKKWRTMMVPDPYQPPINARTKSVEGAVVYLESVDPARSRPWDHPPVRVVAGNNAMHIEQGDGSPFSVGFVRRGEEVDLVSHRPDFESISARGAAFFTLLFPVKDQPLRRKFNEAGLVELTSGAGHFWLRANVFVSEHPYFCRTDADGRYELKQVPPGEYRLCCWLPNPEVARRDRDPNMGHVIRHHHAPPLERCQMIELTPQQQARVDMQIGSKIAP